MSLEISPVSFCAKVPKIRKADVNQARLIDSANQAAEDLMLSQRPKEEQAEVVHLRMLKYPKFKSFLQRLAKGFFDEGKETKIDYDLH